MRRGGLVSALHVADGGRMRLIYSLIVLVAALLFSAPPAGAEPVAPLRAPLAGQPVVLTPFTAPPTRFGAGHRGVDLAAPVNTPVVAPADGVVVYAGLLVDRGVVSIDHTGGLRTSYEPVTALVSAGQRVLEGQIIGTVTAGHPRCAPAVCLHWGARINGDYVDPMLLLAPLHVRLLPWDG